MNTKKLARGVVIIFCILMFTACSSKVRNTESFNDKNIMDEMSKELLEDNSIQAPTNNRPQEKYENEDKFSAKWYVDVNKYGIAPSELTNRDMERPENNTEWIKNLVIKYPQLYNLEDYEKEKRINDMLYKEAAYYHDVLESRDYNEYHVDYEIMEANEDIISILFLGEVSGNQSSNRFAHGITIDINHEKLLKLEDFLVIDKAFVKNHLYTDFDIVENNFDEVTENTPFVEEYVENYGQYAHTKDYYVKGDNIGIIIPTHDSMGYILIQGKVETK